MTEPNELRERAITLAAELLKRLGQDGVRELEVRQDGLRVRVVAAGQPSELPSPAASGPATVAQPALAAAAPERAAPARVVPAPLTGIFYRSSSPQTAAFVQTGSLVAVGDVIGLIEAMKLFNEIRSTVSGTVRKVLVENGQLVRAHQPLLELDS